MTPFVQPSARRTTPSDRADCVARVSWMPTLRAGLAAYMPPEYAQRVKPRSFQWLDVGLLALAPCVLGALALSSCGGSEFTAKGGTGGESSEPSAGSSNGGRGSSGAAGTATGVSDAGIGGMQGEAGQAGQAGASDQGESGAEVFREVLRRCFCHRWHPAISTKSYSRRRLPRCGPPACQSSAESAPTAENALL